MSSKLDGVPNIAFGREERRKERWPWMVKQLCTQPGKHRLLDQWPMVVIDGHKGLMERYAAVWISDDIRILGHDDVNLVPNLVPFTMLPCTLHHSARDSLRSIYDKHAQRWTHQMISCFPSPAAGHLPPRVSPVPPFQHSET